MRQHNALATCSKAVCTSQMKDNMKNTINSKYSTGVLLPMNYGEFEE